MKTLLLGGVRPGKSQLAEDMAEDMATVASLRVVAAA
jgi:adenosyl cobinamide kinase/adenosyl cobinamide phosphate guanylyltransferase